MRNQIEKNLLVNFGGVFLILSDRTVFAYNATKQCHRNSMRNTRNDICDL